jgi:tetratricopeptide (TPR) repeat protein
LHTDQCGCTLAVGREVKIEISGRRVKSVFGYIPVWGFMAMNCGLAARVFILFSPLIAAQAGAQAATLQRAEPSVGSSKAARDSQKLFNSIPVSTHSEEANKYLELAFDKYESGLFDDAMVHAKHATEKDPRFALAYALLSFAGRTGTPDATALARAKSFLPRATPDEQLLVRWMNSVEEGDLLPAILTMNNLLKRYPADKHVLYLTSEWLYLQQDYDRARQLMETTLRVDPNFAPTLNLLGYAYLETGNPDPAKAIASLKRYAQLQPGQPNPQKSLAEILRYTGDDQGSVEHYAGALQLDPTFFVARVGLADTLTLMGDYSDARDQYDKAISVAESSRDRYHAEYQKALVFFWEGHSRDGRKTLEGLAEKAVAEKEPYAQFEIGFALALLAPNAADEFAQLKSLESFLQGPVAGMTDTDRNASLGAAWRERARAYASSGDLDAASQAVQQLEELAAHTRDMVVENTYESAHGYVLFAQGDVANATDELFTDLHNPLVLRQFILAQEKLGNSSDVEAYRTRLKYLRASTVEWFLVESSAASPTAD